MHGLPLYRVHRLASARLVRRPAEGRWPFTRNTAKDTDQDAGLIFSLPDPSGVEAARAIDARAAFFDEPKFTIGQEACSATIPATSKLSIF